MNKDFPGHGASKPCSNAEWVKSLFFGGGICCCLSEAELYKTGLLSFDLFLEQVFKQCRNDFKSLFTF